MSDEPITAYRRVQTMEGWALLDEISTELTPCAPGDGGRAYSTWVVYNHARREYVSGAPWPREAGVDDSPVALSRDLQELRAEVAQLHQEVEFWTKGATTWRERALEYWDAGGEKQEEELVERVAKWAHEEARHQALKSWEELPSSAQEQWLSRARAAIEGEK